MIEVAELFRSLVSRIDLVRHHSFDNGYDNGVYYNFTFGTERPAELWTVMQESIFQVPAHKAHMAAAAMAMCSSEQGWEDYVQLYHWDPEVPVVSAVTP
ncbi:MAG: hypothetical protein LBQ20_00645 [Rhodanobacter sp.]|jgi:hypothetical protein|nr:hypothetical protein [Rhodanobacter sp.]